MASCNGILTMDYDTATKSEDGIFAVNWGNYKGKLQGEGTGVGVFDYETSHDWLIANNTCDKTNCAASGVEMSFEWSINLNATGKDAVSQQEIIDSITNDGVIFHISPERHASVSVMPIPPAAWLFGSALVLLGWTARKAT